MAAAGGTGGSDRSQQPDLTHLSQAISQAVFSCAEASVPKLPWEEAGLSVTNISIVHATHMSLT